MLSQSSEELLQTRTVSVTNLITDERATEVIAKLLYLESAAADQPITLLIDSPGGSVTAGLAVLDTIEHLKPEVRTHCTTNAHAMAAILLASGKKGHRSASGAARISFSMPWPAKELTPAQQKQFDRLIAVLVSKTVAATGMQEQRVKSIFESETNFTAAAAIQAGIVDEMKDR